MGLKLYNTLTRTKDDFVPIDPSNVRLYVCGPTVYDFAHIGNARPVIVFDMLYRLLRHSYGEGQVKYVRNITDVDDKINARAAEEYPGLPLNEAIRKVTEKTEAQFHADVDALGCLRPDVEPRATEHIPEMLDIIETLVREGHAYPAEGHVLFDVKSWKAADGTPLYGRLSRRSLDDMLAGARVEVAPYKKDPMDFVLWKPSKPGEPAWSSAFGEGRPGWHIECSAMAEKHLGAVFDIHGGGIDLVFPHHENEIAQSCCAHHTDLMAGTWMHNGFLQVEGEKMSKSLGNFFTIRQLLEEWPGAVMRFQMLMSHYRQPLDWTRQGSEKALDALDSFRMWTSAASASAGKVDPAVIAALEDDLNTPQAVAELHRLGSEARKGGEQAAADLLATCQFLGIDLAEANYQEVARRRHGAVDEARIEELIAARIAARQGKNFAEADRLRGELDAMGIILMDGKNAEGELVTRWELKKG